MPSPTSLQERARRFQSVLQEYRLEHNEHPLVCEFAKRLDDALEAIETSEQFERSTNLHDPEQVAMSNWMFAVYNLNRCQAIYDLLSDTNYNHIEQDSSGHLNKLSLSRDKILIRWLTSIISRARARAFGDEDFYVVPSLWDALMVYAANRLALNTRLKKTLRSFFFRSSNS